MSTLALQPLLGKHVTAVTWTPQTNTAGVLADTTPVETFTGLLQSMSSAINYATQDIQAMDTPRDNAVQISVGASVRLKEFLQTDTTKNFSPVIGYTGGYWKFTYTRATKVWTVWVLITGYTEEFDRGPAYGELTATIVDIGATSLVYA